MYTNMSRSADSSNLDQQLHRSVLKREAIKERQYREERAKKEEEFYAQLGTGGTEMSKAELKKIIDSDRRMYYRTEELNDKLYIHYKGWRKIENLEGWTGLRALYAECNAFSEIQGLDTCRNLRSLFLQENAIRRISGLDNCPMLWSLNLSNNFIERLENMGHLQNLNTLIITKNKLGLKGIDDVIELQKLDALQCLDIQDNLIWDVDVLPEVFMQMAQLRVLYLKGNPCAKQMPNYRKSITAYCTDLRYLDDRPVFPEDRRTAEAFNRGGLEEERAERRRIREENSARHEANMKAFQLFIDEAKARGREYKAMRLEDKYTEENDPVDSDEKRMKRMVDKWKEDNAEDLKDDMYEYAKATLAKERAEAGAKPGEGSTTSDVGAMKHGGVLDGYDPYRPGSSEKKPEEPDEKHETALTKAIDEQLAQDEAAKNKVDNRKLVYDDIWDDAPVSAPSKPPAPAPTSGYTFAPPPRRAAGNASASAGDGGPETDAAGSRAEPASAVAGADSAAGGDLYATYRKKFGGGAPTEQEVPAEAPSERAAQAAMAAAASAAAGPARRGASELQEMD